MARKLKFLGLALAAVFAMSAVGVSAASATVQVHFEGSPITLTGNQEGTTGFDVQYGEVKCTTATYHGTTTALTDTTVTVTPHYTGCTFAGITAEVHPNGCSYVLHVTNAGPPYTGLVDIVCPVGQEITVTGGTKCTVHVPPQTGLGPITYTNVGGSPASTREVTLDLGGIKNVKYTQTEGSGVGKCTNQSTSAGLFTGNVTVTGETDTGTTHTGIWVE